MVPTRRLLVLYVGLDCGLPQQCLRSSRHQGSRQNPMTEDFWFSDKALLKHTESKSALLFV